MSMMDLPPPLKPTETLELLRAYKAGDEEAKEKVIEGNLRLVVHIAKKYDNTGLDIEDLFSIGLIGMIKAVHTFNTEKEVKFATYASRCIDNEILMFLRKGKKIKAETSIDSPITTDIDGHELTLMDVTPDKNIQHFSEVFEWNDTMAEVRAALEGLSPRDKDIILMRYFQNQTQREVSAALDISQSYISRIEKKILKKIKKTIESNQAKAERNEEKMARGIAPANKKEVIHLLKTTTMSYKEINEKTGVPYSTIATYAQKHRPKEVRKEKMTNHPGMVREHSGDTDKAVQLLAEGKYTYAEISKQTGVPTGSLTRLRRLYEKGDYKWVNEPKKRVEIEVPVETPVINHPAFMGEKDKERLVEQVPVVKHEVEQVEIKKPEQPVVNMAEAIEEFKAEIKAELRAEVEAEVRKEMAAESVATETSPMGKIQKLLTFKYHASGGNVPTEDFVAEMKELISMLEESNNGSITFTLNVEAE